MASKKKAKKELNDRQRAFVEHYLTTWNASESARRAGHSAKTAAAIGWENLRKPEIRNEIEKRLSEFHMGADEVLARLASMARGSLYPFTDSGGNVTLDTDTALANFHLLKKVKVKTRSYGRDDPVLEKETEIEIHDPQAALVQLGRHHNLFIEKQAVEHSGETVLRVIYDDKRIDNPAPAPAPEAGGVHSERGETESH